KASECQVPQQTTHQFCQVDQAVDESQPLSLALAHVHLGRAGALDVLTDEAQQNRAFSGVLRHGMTPILWAFGTSVPGGFPPWADTPGSCASSSRHRRRGREASLRGEPDGGIHCPEARVVAPLDDLEEETALKGLGVDLEVF